MTEDEQRQLGAYYTSSSVAAFLARWAIQRASDIILDPSYGEAALLLAAGQRIGELGGSARCSVHGVEKRPDTHALVSRRLESLGLADSSRLFCADFFSITPDRLPQVDAVIGNPPFIRFHKFSGKDRERALARATEAGVSLSGQSSAWAPFVVHALRFVRSGGRVALVLPTELLHARYAAPVLRCLAKSFAESSVLRFGQRLFPELQQDALIYLGAGKGLPGSEARIIDLNTADDLEGFTPTRASGVKVDLAAIADGTTRSAESQLSKGAALVLQQLTSDRRVSRLGTLATIRIGYVTGAAEFFHLTSDQLGAAQLSKRDVRPVIRAGRELTGARFSLSDWKSLNQAGFANWLLAPRWPDRPDTALARLIGEGKKDGVHTRAKCKARDPWWYMGPLSHADAVLPTLSHTLVRMVRNDTQLPVSNALLDITFHDRRASAHDAVVLSAYSSLGQVSAAIEGHALGGGALKLDPREVRRIAVVNPTSIRAARPARQSLIAVDAALRSGKTEQAIEMADKEVLEGWLGLSSRDAACLRRAVRELSATRRK